jgi:membrane protein
MRALKFAVPLGWTEILKRTSKEILAGNCFGWAASLAYYFFLALFPALLFVVSLASVLPVQHLIDRIVAMLSRVAPGDVVAIAQRQFVQITRQPHGGVLTLGLVAALWSTSSGMTAIVDTLNQAYHITESRPWWRVRVTAIGLTLALTIVTLIAFALVMVGPTIAQQAADWLTLGPLFRWTWNIVRWPAAFALVVTAIGCIYHFAPDTRHEWVWITPGSVMATVMWLLISLAFKWYVSHFAGYQKTYGAIGGVMVALLWFYFTSLAILLGAQLDATIEHASPSAPRRGAAAAVNPAAGDEASDAGVALHPVGHWPTGTR